MSARLAELLDALLLCSQTSGTQLKVISSRGLCECPEKRYCVKLHKYPSFPLTSLYCTTHTTLPICIVHTHRLITESLLVINAASTVLCNIYYIGFLAPGV